MARIDNTSPLGSGPVARPSAQDHGNGRSDLALLLTQAVAADEFVFSLGTRRDHSGVNEGRPW